MELSHLGKTLIALALGQAVVGVLLLVAPRVPGLNLLGRLPGDISLGDDNFRLYIPLGTTIVLSVLASIALTMITHLFR